MEAALTVAAAGLLAGELPIGAVVVADGAVIGRAHTEELGQGRLLVHAELLALDEADRVAGWDRRSATLYTTLEPCLMCLGAAATAMVGRVVYALDSDSDGAGRLAGEWSARRTADLPHVRLPDVVSGIGRAEAVTLFERYAASRSDDDPMARWVRSLLP